MSESVDTRNLSRTQIIQITRRCFDETGYDGVTIRAIARDLGCAVGSIYRYFEDKRALLSATAQDQFESVAKMVESGGSFEESLKAYVDCAKASPQLYHLMFWLCTIGTDAGVARRGPRRLGRQGLSPQGIASPTISAEVASEDETLPSVVRRIVAEWGRRLGYDALARQCWASVHGQLALGHSPAAILDTALEMLGHAGDASRRQRPVPQHGPSPIHPIAPDTIGPAPASTSLTAGVTFSPPLIPADDDVCLL